MFFRLYKTRIKCLLRDKQALFWSFAYPIILSLFFFMAFNNLDSHENIDTIQIAVTGAQTGENELLTVLKSVEISEEKKLFQVQEVNVETAKQLLIDEKIAGYIDVSDSNALYIKENGINQTIIKSFLDGYEQKSQTIKNILASNPQAINNGLLDDIMDYKNYVQDGADKDRKPDYVVVFYYTLIAMTCMFGCNWGFGEMVHIQADQSPIAARINIAPTHKFKILSINYLAAFTLHFLSILMLLGFLKYVLQIKFGNNLGVILLTCVIGSLCGIALGSMICVTLNINLKVREALLTVITIGGGFLAGMMNVEIKYLITTNAPIIGYINPSNLITDAFYSLYYYEGYSRVYFNLCLLTVLTVIFGTVTYLKIRRKEYASI